MPKIIPLTLSHAFALYSKEQPKGKVADLKTVLRRHLLPYIPGQSFTGADISSQLFRSYLTKILMKDLDHLNLEAILQTHLQEAVEAQRITQRTSDNYISDFRYFLRWMSIQDWYETACGAWDKRFAVSLTSKSGSFHKSRAGKGKSNNIRNYAVKNKDFPERLKLQIKEYSCFWQEPVVPDRQDDALRGVTLFKHIKNIRIFLGWINNIELNRINNLRDSGVTLKPLESYLTSFNTSFDLCLLEDIRIIKAYIAWGINHKGNGHGWAETVIKASLSVSKFLHAHESSVPQYRDIPEVEAIRTYLNPISKKALSEAANRDVTEKEMTHQQCEAVVDYLRRTCAPQGKSYKKRSLRAIMMSRQKSLLISILTYCPIRGSEIRQLELGRTLLKKNDGYWLDLGPLDNKTDKKRRVHLSKWLPSSVIADLEEWLTLWRPKAKSALNNIDSWLEFWGYQTEDQEVLAYRIDQAKLNGRSQSYINQLQANLRGFKNLLKTWEAKPWHSKDHHNYVFFSLGSAHFPETVFRPYCDSDPEIDDAYRSNFSLSVKTAIYKTTALLGEQNHPLFIGVDPKLTHPHFYRSIDSTEIRRKGASHEVLKAFHEGIGNSIKTGDKSYNLLAPEEKTAAAAHWWKDSEPQDEGEKTELLKKLLFELPPEQRKVIKNWI